MNRYSSKLLNLALTLSMIALVAGCSQRGEQAAQEGAAEEGTADVTGTWDLTFDSSMGAIIWKVNFQQDGTALTGTVELASGNIILQAGRAFGIQAW